MKNILVFLAFACLIVFFLLYSNEQIEETVKEQDDLEIFIDFCLDWAEGGCSSKTTNKITLCENAASLIDETVDCKNLKVACYFLVNKISTETMPEGLAFESMAEEWSEKCL